MSSFNYLKQKILTSCKKLHG